MALDMVERRTGTDPARWRQEAPVSEFEIESIIGRQVLAASEGKAAFDPGSTGLRIVRSSRSRTARGCRVRPQGTS